jgi:hypothetical protein
MNDRVGFSTTKAWLSRLIRWFTDASVSHAWILYFDLDFGREMVLEATLEGVRIIPYEVFQQHNTIIKVCIPSHSLKQGFAKVGETLGAAYDFGGLFGMLWVLFGRWCKKKLKNPWNRTQAMFCSEFVAQVLRWSYYPGTEYWTPAEMSPQDLYAFFLRQEAKEAHGR